LKSLSIISAFFLISVFSSGTFFIHLHFLKSYKKEFKTYLKTTRHSSFKSILFIHPSELYADTDKLIWEDENKEIVYDGVLYDILEIRSEGTRLALIAVSDFREMEMKRVFSEIYANDAHKSGKQPFSLLKSLLNLKTTFGSSYVLPDVYAQNYELFSTQPDLRIASIFLQAETPPPDFLN
jgi:hypothetical protein